MKGKGHITGPAIAEMSEAADLLEHKSLMTRIVFLNAPDEVIIRNTGTCGRALT